MLGYTFNVRIGTNQTPCVIGLNWLDKVEGNKPHAIVKLDDKPNQFGYPSTETRMGHIHIKVIDEGVSLAAWAAETYPNGIVVSSVEVPDTDGGTVVQYWMCAISEGIILKETDRLYHTVKDLEDAIMDTTDVLVDIQTVHQLCSSSIQVAGIEFVYNDLTPDLFRKSMTIVSHGLTKKHKQIISGVLIGTLALGGIGYFLYGKQKDGDLAQQAMIAASQAQRQSIATQNHNLQYTNPILAADMVKEISELPQYVAGWQSGIAKWNKDEQTIEVTYKRLDGTINLFKEAVQRYSTDVVVDEANIDQLTMTKHHAELIGHVEGELSNFQDVNDALVSLFQDLSNRKVSMRNTVSFVDAMSPAITWEMVTKHPMIVINSLTLYGFTIQGIKFVSATDDWTLNGEFYAK